MKQYRFINHFLAIAFIAGMAGFAPANKVDKAVNSTGTDSVSFTPNTSGAWSLYSYYLNQKNPDSVEFELILKHNYNIDWTNEKLIGTITDSDYIPLQSQAITYSLLPGNTWKVRIKKNGECYLQPINGSVPASNLFIIPIKVKYRNN